MYYPINNTTTMTSFLNLCNLILLVNPFLDKDNKALCFIKAVFSPFSRFWMIPFSFFNHFWYITPSSIMVGNEKFFKVTVINVCYYYWMLFMFWKSRCMIWFWFWFILDFFCNYCSTYLWPRTTKGTPKSILVVKL